MSIEETPYRTVMRYLNTVDYLINNAPIKIERKTIKQNEIRSEILRKFDDYLLSDIWLAIKDKVSQRDRRKCWICRGESSIIYHKDYTLRTLMGFEIDSLVSLCSNCTRRIQFDDEGNKRTNTESNKVLKKLGYARKL